MSDSIEVIKDDGVVLIKMWIKGVFVDEGVVD